jgi:hypothetical protein
MCYNQKSISFDGLLVLYNAVLRNADAEKSCAKRAQPTDQNGTLDSGNDDPCQVTQDHDRPDHRNGQKYSAEEQTPKAAPKCALLTPKFNSVADIVETHNLFLGMKTLSDDTEMRHVETTGSKFADSVLCILVINEYSDYSVMLIQLECHALFLG